jgi:hypothetical protein
MPKQIGINILKNRFALENKLNSLVFSQKFIINQVALVYHSAHG